MFHIFGARETGAKPGFGLAGAFINDINNAYPSATTEAIAYPANGQANLENQTYKDSVRYGVGNATQQVAAFAKMCPDAKIVLVGYSQGSKFDARPSDQIHCGDFDDTIQLYCDADDEFCTNGTSLAIHNGYHGVYGKQALAFVKSKLG
ncbi:Acetylxylan esterase 2 [Fulvia fulva]|uniref:Acetylxylan esterase 2 n=1 Tax=Passalora fulva TaxID=5499 RepID=A0A9Q8P988_PASFU|nr:Acetylxylan esterase 2 [Fulvia fulva]KAK4624588.1 Acetylxylan esterase 2 [Fulvia fulva]KAK4625833.1 Acetylxylan esterase 2 [Fulvia fulva]UJO18014.1 Acetylxylan esterase 2 [Fulvia fulva]WPV15323.1 Acetylxylan esterase 2 [Fulvia fulva]WPV29524.1 Acetylxylan esterase 2 [Fulvia fulva]